MEDFQIRYNRTSQLLEEVAEKYYQGGSCACQHPRFIQIVGINCVAFGKSFKAWETTLLISKVKKNFEIKTLENGIENSNERWTCKICKSEFHFGWSDFSTAVEREVLFPIDIKAKENGKKAEKPIPLYAGLYGHSYPPKKEIESVEFETFEKYITEK